jgi:hypothetical protein
MKIQPIVVITLGVMLMPGAAKSVELYAPGKTDAEIRTEIVIRCQSQMGEFGSEAIDICVQAEHESRKQLAGYPDEYFGWNRIKLCSDKDIAARDALAAYPPVHAELIANCQDQVGRYGYNEVKKCVDDKLAASGESAQ